MVAYDAYLKARANNARVRTDVFVPTDSQAAIAFKELVGGYNKIVHTQHKALTVAPTVDGYELGRELGRGGMGVVYEAVQQNPRRRVALKFIGGAAHLGRDSIRLLDREARALARLNHPNIASIYEVGHSAQGQPFFAMELVEGLALDQYLAQSTLRMDQKLELFRAVCAAIIHSHQRGIIHRDLKPSNIIVGRDGQPKVVDFGLSLVNDLEHGTSTRITRMGDIKGTVPYMSPEQLMGRHSEIDVRTDVYALGVILYQLMTGSLPHEVSGLPLHQATKEVCESSVRKPSQLNQKLRGDLEIILLKSLDKEPERRYASVSALSDDLGHYMAHEPIMARMPSAGYHVRKFVRRYKWISLLVSAIAVLILSFSAAIYWQSRILKKERDVAVRADGRSRSMISYLRDLLVQTNPANIGYTKKIDEALDAVNNKASRRIEHDPELDARISLLTSNVYFGTYRIDEAQRYANKACDWVSENPQAPMELYLECDLIRGRLQRALGDYSAAARRFSQVLEYEIDTETRATTHQALGQCYRSLGQYELAISEVQKAMALRSTAKKLANDKELLSAIYSDMTQYKKAMTAIDEALSLLEGSEPSQLQARCLAQKGYLWSVHSNTDRAMECHRKALAVMEESQGKDSIPYAEMLVRAAAVNYTTKRDLQAAHTQLRDARSVYTNSNLWGHLLSVDCRFFLARVLLARGEVNESRILLESTISILDGCPEARPYVKSTIHGLMGRIAFRSGNFDEAVSQQRIAIDYVRRMPDDSRLQELEALLNLTHALVLKKQDIASLSPDVFDLYERHKDNMRILLFVPRMIRFFPEEASSRINLRSVWDRLKKTNRVATAVRLCRLSAEMHLAEENLVEAQHQLDKAKMAVVHDGTPLLQLSPEISRCQGQVYMAQGRYSDAIPELQVAVSLSARRFSHGHPELSRNEILLAECLIHTGEYQQAARLLEPAITSLMHHYGEADEEVCRAQAMLDSLQAE